MTDKDSENSPTRPSWDGSQLAMASWLESLEQWLFKKDDDYLTLTFYGYVTSKLVTVFPTEIHAVARRQIARLRQSSVGSNRAPLGAAAFFS